MASSHARICICNNGIAWSDPEAADHPPEHEDRPYEMVAPAFEASFMEDGTFDLESGDGRWQLARGDVLDVLLGHPGMPYRASFDGGYPLK